MVIAFEYAALLSELFDDDVDEDHAGHEQLLLEASADGDESRVKEMLDRGVNLEVADRRGRTALRLAAERGHIRVVELLVNNGADIEGANRSMTPLMGAAANNRVEVVRFLVNSGAVVNAAENHGRTPLISAMENSEMDQKRLFLSHKADANAMDWIRWTPISWASNRGETNETRPLIDHNSGVNLSDWHGRTQLMQAVKHNEIGLMQMLLSNGSEVNAKDSEGLTPLMMACKYGHTEAVQLLIEHNANVNASSSDGMTPLMLACKYGHVRVVQLLIVRHVNANVSNPDGWSPLMMASRYGHVETMRVLIDHVADLDAMDERCMTPLMLATKYGHTAAVRHLVACGASVGTNYRKNGMLFQWSVQFDYDRVEYLRTQVLVQPDIDEAYTNDRAVLLQLPWRGRVCTANNMKDLIAKVDTRDTVATAMPANVAQKGKANAVRLLVAYGADVDAEIENGQTPLMLAATNGSTDVVRVLLDCGATINATSSSTGETALMTAARHGHEQVARLLLRYGVNVNAVSTNGETALSIATKYGRNSIANLLARHVVYEDDEMETQDEWDRDVHCSWFISPFELEFLRVCDIAGDIRGTWLGAEVIVKLFVSGATNATFIDEVNLWHKLRHPNIIKLYGACNVGHHFFVYEYASSGSLVDYLRKCDPDGRTPWKYLHEAALGLKYLHERGIVHGDLRGSNILIGNDGLAKMSAFDVSASSNTREASESGEWVRWASPEAIRGEQTTVSSDIFSFGVCMLEALTRRQPWSDLAEEEVMERHRSFESLDQPLDLDLSTDHWDAISRMCCSNSLDRLTVSAVVQKLETFSNVESKKICQFTLPEFNPPDALDDEKTERRLSKAKRLVKHSDNALHHQLVGDLDLVHAQLRNIQPTRALVDRFLDVLRQCCAALRVISAKHRIYQLSSTQATVNNVHELHRRVVQLLQDMGAPSDVVTNCKELWKVIRQEQMEMFVSAVSNKCVILQRLETEDDRKTYLAILKEEMHNQEATYTDHQLAVMRNAHDAIANQTLDDVPLTSPPEWFIPWFELDKNGMSWIADGGFGSVSRWRWLDSEVVVKTMLTYDGMDCSKKHHMRKMFEREANIWFRLSHPHVIKLFGACHVGRPFFVCEYASNGTLNNYIRRHPDRVWIKLREAVLGVQYLHARGIVHGDLKGNNIVIGADEKAKVVDFGLSWLCDDSSTVAPVSGACGWVAPKCLEEKPATPTLASDVYSLGMCIIEALNVIGNVKITTPWGDLLPVVVKREATDGKLPTRPQNCSSEVWHLVERMCKRDPADRIRIATVVEELTKLAMQSEKCEDLNKKSAESTIFALPLSEQDEKALELYPPPDEESVVDLIDGVQAHIIGHLDELKATYTSRTLGAIYRLLWERLQDVIEHLQDQDEEIITEAAFNHFVLVARARTLLLVENMHQPKLVRFTEGALGGYGLHRRLDTLLDSNRVVLNNHELHDWRAKFSAMLGIE